MSTEKKKNKVNTRRAILLRAYLVFGLAVLFGVIVLVSIARLQLGSDEEFSKILKQKNTRVTTVKAIRGNIYAHDGSLLATSVPKYNMIFDANSDGLTDDKFKASIDSFSMLMAVEFPEKNAAEWKNHLSSLRRRKIRYTVLAKEMGFDVVKRMKNWPLIRNGKFKSGIWYEEHGKRLYFMGELAKRTIGYSRQGVYVGLEGAFDSLLRGTDGKRMEQRMPGNIWRPVKANNFNNPQNGYDIVTTLDIRLQDVAQYALNKVLEENEADHGCVLVMEVATGAVKAMANLKRGKDGKYFEAQNYAVDEFSDPGSTFKLISAMALIEDGHCKPEDSVDVEWGETRFHGQVMKDASKPNKRILTLQETFEKSSNVGISKLIMKYYGENPKKFTGHAIRLGLNMRPDFDIRSTNQPKIKTKNSSDWSAITLPWMSIGYEMKLSPLQMLMVYNSIANNGKMMKPYMVSEIRQEGRLISKIEPKVLNEKICSDETLGYLKKMLEGVVDHGTATNLKNQSYTVAGKTGTAQILKGQGGYDKSSYKASFAGYFPAENPQYTIIVVINEPKKGIYYGALVAGPVFKEIADKVYAGNVQLHPGLPTPGIPMVPQVLSGNVQSAKFVLNELGISSKTDSVAVSSGWGSASKNAYAVELKGRKIVDKTIPDVIGMGIRDALLLLEKAGLKVTYEGYGKIRTQSLASGSKAIPGSTIHLILKP